VNFLTTDADLEHAAARRHQPQGADALLELEEFDRQTDGLRLVVSSRTIFDREFGLHLRMHRILRPENGQGTRSIPAARSARSLHL
jgi:hypothetical protein